MLDSQEITLIISLFSLGFFGGFTHCIGMCGPFVLMQVGSNLAKIDINNISILKKLSGASLIPYHLGRITTYSFLGLASSFMATNIKTISNFNALSSVLLLIASLIIMKLLFKELKLSFKFSKITKLLPSINFKYLNIIMSYLFNNPQGFRGYILGILLGFIPCGLLYGAIAIAATINDYFIAAFAMLIFGLSTIPSLLMTSYGSLILFKKIETKIKVFSRFILLINMITLFIMAFYQIN